MKKNYQILLNKKGGPHEMKEQKVEAFNETRSYEDIKALIKTPEFKDWLALYAEVEPYVGLYLGEYVVFCEGPEQALLEYDDIKVFLG